MGHGMLFQVGGQHIKTFPKNGGGRRKRFWVLEALKTPDC